MERTDRARDAVTRVTLSAVAWPASRSAGVAGARLAEFMTGVLEAYLEAVGGDAAGLWEHDRDGWSEPLFVTPREVWDRLPFGRTLTRDAARIHPGVQHCLEARPTRPFTVTDLISETSWQTSEIGRAMHAQWGRNFQLMVPVDARSAGRRWWVWVVGREHSDFTLEDRQVASAVEPVLTAVTRRFAEVRRQLVVQLDLTVSLTTRERDVVQFLVQGHAVAEIAGRLSISTRTVHKHVEHIYRKLGVHDRRELVDATQSPSGPVPFGQ